MPFSPESRLGDVLDSDEGQRGRARAPPADDPELPFPVQARHATIRQLVDLVRPRCATTTRHSATCYAGSPPCPTPPPTAPLTSARHGPQTSVRKRRSRGPRALTAPPSGGRWGVFEAEIRGPAHGNPYVDVELSAEFRQGDRVASRARASTTATASTGSASCPTRRASGSSAPRSNARSLDGIAGAFTCTPAGARPPTDRSASTTRSTSATPTARAASRSAPPRTRGRTRETSSRSRRCARSPARRSPSCGCASSRSTTCYNANEPERFRSRARSRRASTSRGRTPRSSGTSSGASRQLGELGIEADLILFHAYDRWGFSDMGAAADDRYVRYVVARLAAFQNVWWSLANEYDLLWSKDAADWDRFAGWSPSRTRTGTCSPSTTACASSTTTARG